MATQKSKKRLVEYDNSGFSTQTSSQGGRLVRADGTFNVKRHGLKLSERFSFYHALITMPWYKLALGILAGFFIANVLFAQIYIWLGIDGLTGIHGTTPARVFAEVFFFSAQTLTTVGYGQVSPTGVSVGLVASLESMLGLMGFALATGILYGRFSAPVARLRFSKGMVVAPYKSQLALMFRLANVKSNTLSDVSCLFMVSWIQIEDGGEQIRKYFTLDMERATINTLPLSWTVVHPITADSPLYGLTKNDLLKRETEFIITIKGWDETSRQTYTARTSYLPDTIEWGAKFPPMFTRTPDNAHTVLSLEMISNTVPTSLPAPLLIALAEDVKSEPSPQEK